MTVTFFRTDSDNRVLRKSLTSRGAKTATPYESCSVLNPSLILAYDATVAADANYMYISDFGRYYYLNDITLAPGNRMIVTGDVDVLMSYVDSISALTVNAERSESERNQYIPDNTYGYTNTADTKVYVADGTLITGIIEGPTIASGADAGYYMLGVIGRNSAST